MRSNWLLILTVISAVTGLVPLSGTAHVPQNPASPGDTAAKAVTSGQIDVKPNKARAQHDWPVFGGSAENNHYSPLLKINRSNVKQLTMAWTFDTGESGGLQTSPIEI